MQFFDTDIVFKEIPDHTTLAFCISGCPNHCVNCHWKNINHINKELTDTVLTNYCFQYSDLITCVLFLGGEWDEKFIEKLKIVQFHGLKTALYTGLELNQISESILSNLDFIKVGQYIEQYGGLDNKDTNQRLYNVKNGEDLTYKLWKQR